MVSNLNSDLTTLKNTEQNGVKNSVKLYLSGELLGVKLKELLGVKLKECVKT